MRVLIIGCGYIGIPLATRLAHEGQEVYGLSRSILPTGSPGSAVIPLQADITRPETLVDLPSAYDWVVLCVASSGGTAEDYRRLYLEGAGNVLQWLASTPPKKLVYTSSTSVYGQEDGSLVEETSATAPSSATGRILAETERLLLKAARSDKSPTVILRLAGIYGPGRGYWFKQFLSGDARIEGKGKRYLNMIHRDDVVGAIIKALDSAPSGGVYNVVDDEPVTQFAFFTWLSKRLRRAMPPVALNEAEVVRKRGSSNKRVSNRKLRVKLGYHLKFPTFREGYEPEIQALESQLP